MYNCTPHSSTGLSPFSVYMGREPTLPIDLMFGLAETKTTPSPDLDAWVKQHQQKLKDAAALARGKMQQKAENRCKRNDVGVNDKGIPIGTRVLLRSHPLGRNKIADHWKATPYVVVSQPQQNVYEIQLADGTGPLKRVTRTEILNTKEVVPSEEGQQEEATPKSSVVNSPMSETEDQGDNTTSLDGSTLVMKISYPVSKPPNPVISSSSPVLNIQPQGTDVAAEPAVDAVSFDSPSEPKTTKADIHPESTHIAAEPAMVAVSVDPVVSNVNPVVSNLDPIVDIADDTQQSTSTQDEPVSKPLRQSTRQGAGKHSNPFNLPRTTSHRLISTSCISANSTLLSDRLEGWIDGFLQQAVTLTTPLQTSEL